MLVGMMGQCTSLAHLDLNFNQIGNAGAETLAGVPGQCPTLVYLDLRSNNGIGSETTSRLRTECRGTLSSLLLVEDGI
jgi:Ran GTPase-activating protein (RanGAP) involved in mRNA processing and transport